jgi:hypothetical protein
MERTALPVCLFCIDMDGTWTCKKDASLLAYLQSADLGRSFLYFSTSFVKVNNLLD